MSKFVALLILVPMLDADLSLAGSIPQEPEKDNREYVLDEVTNGYNLIWREIWDSKDNRLRFRFGSNNVREWYIEEELKFSTRLLSRVRLRFYHSRILDYTTRRWNFNTLELEGNIFGNYYFSFYAMPTEFKSDNAIGFIWQRRTAVNRYSFLYLELPRFMNNFTEHHKETSDSLLVVYSQVPVKVGIEMREYIKPHLRIRLSGYLTNDFELSEERVLDGRKHPVERGNLQSLAGWLEYIIDEAKSPMQLSMIGIRGAYIKENKQKNTLSFFSSAFRASGLEKRKSVPPACGSFIESGIAAPGGKSSIEGGVKRSTGLGQGFPYIDVGHSFFTLTAGDTVDYWFEIRKFVSPYAWIVAGERWVFYVAARYEKFELRWRNDIGEIHKIDNRYFVPMLNVRLSLGDKCASILEGGLVAEYRTRTEEVIAGTAPGKVREGDFHDHRFYVAYEYFFKPGKAFRIVESIDLDREDWGQFSIHDHGFFQLIVGF